MFCYDKLLYLRNFKLFTNFITLDIIYFVVLWNRCDSICMWIEIDGIVTSFPVPNAAVFG